MTTGTASEALSACYSSSASSKTVTVTTGVPPNGEVVLESTDMGVALYEAREVTGPLGGVPKTA